MKKLILSVFLLSLSFSVFANPYVGRWAGVYTVRGKSYPNPFRKVVGAVVYSNGTIEFDTYTFAGTYTGTGTGSFGLTTGYYNFWIGSMHYWGQAYSNGTLYGSYLDSATGQWGNVQAFRENLNQN